MGVRFIKRTVFITILAAVALVQGALWALLTPPFQAPDEPSHFASVQHLAEQEGFRAPHRGAHLSREVDRALGLLGAERLMHREAVAFQFDDDHARNVEAALAEIPLEDRVAESEALNTAGGYPPAYYLLAAVGYGVARDTPVTGRLLAVRMVSVMLHTLAVILAFLALLELFPGREDLARVGALLVLFLPMFAFLGGAVNCDNLLIPLTFLGIWACARMIRRGPGLGPQVLLALVTILGLATKPTFAAFLPLWPLALWWARKAPGVTGRRMILNGTFLGIAVIGSCAYLLLAPGHLDALTRALEAGRNGEGGSFLEYLGLTFLNHLRPWSAMGRRLLTSYFADFGWLDTRFPFMGLYWVALAGMLITGGLALRNLWKSDGTVSTNTDPDTTGIGSETAGEPWDRTGPSLLAFALSGTVIHFSGVMVLGYFIAGEAWGSGNLQGRYLFPALPLHAAFVVAGLSGIGSTPYARRFAVVLPALLLAAWHLLSLGLVAGRYGL